MAEKKGKIRIVEVSGEDNLVEIAERISLLFNDLSRKGRGRKIESDELAAVLARLHFRLFLVKVEDEIVGMGSLYFRQTLSRHTAYIEDVVVMSEYQGKGLGKLLLNRLIDEARENNVDVIELTSNPDRITANAMYQKTGFVRPETNLYRMYL